MKITTDWAENTDIISLTDMNDEEIEKGKMIIFAEARKLLLDEGYVLDNTLTARPRDAETPHFKDRYARNGFEYRSITNFEGWMVIFRYQRYRRRQQNKIKGTDLEVNFVDVSPRRIIFAEETDAVVRDLYQKGYTVPAIMRAFKMQTGVELKESTIRQWLAKVPRSKREVEENIVEMQKTKRKNKESKKQRGKQ